jgi:hypothetical protein
VSEDSWVELEMAGFTPISIHRSDAWTHLYYTEGGLEIRSAYWDRDDVLRLRFHVKKVAVGQAETTAPASEIKEPTFRALIRVQGLGSYVAPYLPRGN